MNLSATIPASARLADPSRHRRTPPVMTDSAAPYTLLVEPDPAAAEAIRQTLLAHFGTDRVRHVRGIEEADATDLHASDLALAGFRLSDGDGIQLIERLTARRSDLPVIILTSEEDLIDARRSIRCGAYDYIVTAGDFLPTIPLVVEKNLAVWQTKLQNMRLQHELTHAMDALRVKNQQLEDVVRQLEEQALTDPLTGLANRRHVQTMLDHSFAEARRYRSDLACVMIDLDHFKQLNDSRGHLEGDRLLRLLARVLEANSRASDVAGRYGGDEFVVLMPQTSPDVAHAVAKRVSEQFISAMIGSFDPAPECSLSIGIASVTTSGAVTSDELVARADAALYAAKDRGKGCVVIDDAALRAAPHPTEARTRLIREP